MVLLSEVPDAAHPNIKPLKALADQTMVGILARIDASKKEILHLNGMINEVQDEIANKFPINSADVRGRLDEFRDQLLMTEEVYADQFRLASEALATAKEAQRTKDAGVQAQRVWERAHAEAVAKCNIASQTLEKAEEEYTAIVNELEASSDNPHEAEARLKAATFALDEAQKAVGVVAAYERAIESARAATVEELAWKLAEAAIKAVRERFVGETSGSLIDDLKSFWAASGRPETAYLLLENDRGRPIFELGLIRGEERIALGALSEANTKHQILGLAYTITKRTKELRILLIEADPLLQNNFSDLMKWLAAVDGNFDGIIIAKGDKSFSARVDGNFAVEVLG